MVDLLSITRLRFVNRDVMLLNIVIGEPEPESGYGHGTQPYIQQAEKRSRSLPGRFIGAKGNECIDTVSHFGLSPPISSPLQ